jgi:phosphoenolpyruvate-protein phosphotransferase (PTS system enzyme I)
MLFKGVDNLRLHSVEDASMSLNPFTSAQEFTGEIISPGAVRGHVLFLQNDYSFSNVQDAPVADAEQQIARFKGHVDSLENELAEAIAALEEESARQEADILRAHTFLIRDPAFHKDVQREIVENGQTAEAAMTSIFYKMIDAFEQSHNELLAQRAADIRDILARLSRRVNQQSHRAFELLPGDGFVVAAMRELLPSIVLEARHSRVVGFVVERGGPLSHAAILAKSLGFPTMRIDTLQALRGVGDEEILLDATNGHIMVGPDAGGDADGQGFVLPEVEPTRRVMAARLWVNVADPDQVAPNMLDRVEGVGLYRTEVLFMEQTDDFPSEQQQYETYKALFETCGPDRLVTIRTVDIGGDKTLSYFSPGSGQDSYASVRAIRIYRDHPEIFITQVRAILRAAVTAPGLRIMYPMVSSLDDLSLLRKLVGEVIRSLEASGDAYQRDFRQGIMIEVPSAAWNTEKLLDAMDFASVGTNDLFQYFFAASRDDADTPEGCRAHDPAALQVLKHIVDSAARVRKPLSICGEIASDSQLIPLLVGLGFRDLSVDVRSLPKVRQILSNLDVASCEQLAESCLAAKDSREVRARLRCFAMTHDDSRTRRKYQRPGDRSPSHRYSFI